MQKIMIALMVLSILLFSSVSVHAQEAQLNADAGTTPDSIFYGMDKFFDDFSLFFTFDDAKKADKASQIAAERLLEAEVMANEGKAKEAIEAKGGYDSALKEVELRLSIIQERGSSQNALNAAEKISEVQKNIQEQRIKIAEIKKDLANKQINENEKRQLETVINSMLKLSENTDRSADGNKERLKLVVKQAGKSENEIELEFEKIETGTGLKETRKLVLKQEISEADKGLNEAKKILEGKLRQKIDVSELKDNLERSGKLMEKVKIKIDAGNLTQARDLLESLRAFEQSLIFSSANITAEFKTTVKIKGNISQDARAIVNSLKAEFDKANVRKDVRIKAEVKKKEVRFDTRIKGNLTAVEMDLFSSLKEQVIRSFNQTGRIDSKIEIRVRRQLEFENRLQIEIENEFEKEFEIEFEREFEHQDEKEFELERRGRDGRGREDEKRGKEAEGENRSNDDSKDSSDDSSGRSGSGGGESSDD